MIVAVDKPGEPSFPLLKIYIDVIAGVMSSIHYSFFFIIFPQELNSRAQGEVSIREALRELELWGAGAVFSLTSYVDSHNKELSIIKDWKDLVNQVQTNDT